MKFSKHYYLIVDVETTGDQRVADFGAVVVDRKGNIIASLGVLVEGIFGEADFHWALGNPKHTLAKYRGMMASGQRAIASPAFINRWLAEINALILRCSLPTISVSTGANAATLTSTCRCSLLDSISTIVAKTVIVPNCRI